MTTCFLISPANLNGKRAERLLSGESSHRLAVELYRPDGVEIGKLFCFISSLYFRGKLAYAERYGSPGSTFVITAGHGLVTPDWRLTLERARVALRVPIDPKQSSYRAPLEVDAQRLAATLEKRGGDSRVVLLGSLATGKYLEVLEPIFGSALCAPQGFRSLGEMQRGSRLLEAVACGEEFRYESAHGPTGGRSQRS